MYSASFKLCYESQMLKRNAAFSCVFSSNFFVSSNLTISKGYRLPFSIALLHVAASLVREVQFEKRTWHLAQSEVFQIMCLSHELFSVPSL